MLCHRILAVERPESGNAYSGKDICAIDVLNTSFPERIAISGDQDYPQLTISRRRSTCLNLGKIVPRSSMWGHCCLTSSLGLLFGIGFCNTMEFISPRYSHDECLEAASTHQKETGGPYILLFDTLKELFSDAIQADEAATRVSVFIFSNEDFLHVYCGVLSTIIAATHELSDTRDLEKLACLMLALSRLPDVRNKGPETLHLYFNLKYYDIASDQVITVDDGRIWSELPSFGSELPSFIRDCMRGTSYLLPDFISSSNHTSRSYSLHQRRHIRTPR